LGTASAQIRLGGVVLGPSGWKTDSLSEKMRPCPKHHLCPAVGQAEC